MHRETLKFPGNMWQFTSWPLQHCHHPYHYSKMAS